MSTTEITSSPSASPSIHTSTQIVQIQNTNDSSSSPVKNSTQITTTENQDANEENPNHSRAKGSLLAFLHHCKAKRKISQPKPDDNNNSSSKRVHNEAEALSNLISAELDFINKASEKLKKHESDINKASEKFKELGVDGSLDELRKLKKNITRLKQQISSKNKDDSEDADPHRNSQTGGFGNGEQADANKSLEGMPKLYKNPIFERSLAFQDFQVLYDGLSRELKLCLLCFSVFPENVIIKKRLMIYWWIGEGFVCPTPGTEKTAEELANEFFNELIVKGFIKPVYVKRSLEVDSCEMHPFIRSAVIMLAERAKFFDFDPNEEKYIDNFSHSLRACLVGKGLTNIQDLEKLHMVFNVNEMILEFKLEWFVKMKNVNVLYLGRWQTSARHHIEVEDTKFLEGLMNMNHLRFFSLQGVSRITELPESISQLANLRILDLRACHNLEIIPDGIGSLKSLTHLDMSECYLLNQMPKGLASLSELQVLKGFVVGESKGKNSCTLDNLAKLPKLKKLSVYTGLKNFPTETDLHAFQQFQMLQKLTIAWGSGSIQDTTGKSAKQATDAANAMAPDTTDPENDAKEENSAVNSTASDTPNRKIIGDNKKKGKSASDQATTAAKKLRGLPVLRRLDAFRLPVPALPSQLEKLDLQCFPEKVTPSWLMPDNLKGLKKLYIRGGKFSDLGQFQDLDDEGGVALPKKDKWKVEVLRLKYLNELEMDWRELQELFPELIYLEKVKCPKLTFFPCNERGVWMNKTKK